MHIVVRKELVQFLALFVIFKVHIRPEKALRQCIGLFSDFFEGLELDWLVKAALRQVHLITRLWYWLRLPESVGRKKRLNVFELKDLLAYLGTLVLLHLLGNFFEGVLESYTTLVVAICKPFSQLLRILSWYLELLDVDFEEFLEVRLVRVHRNIVLRLVSQLGP